MLALTPEPLQTAGERAVFAELAHWDTGGAVRSAVVASLPMVDGPMGRRISDAVLFVPEGLAVVRIAEVPKQRGVVTAVPEGAWSIAPDAGPGEVLQIAGGGSSPLDGLMRSGMEAALRLRQAGLEPGRIARLTLLVGDLTGLVPADGDLGEGDQVALLESRSLLLGIARAARYAGVANPRLWTTADVRTALEVLGLPGRGPSVEELNGEGFPYSPYVLRRRELLTPAAMNAASEAATAAAQPVSPAPAGLRPPRPPPPAAAAVVPPPAAPVTGGFVAAGPDGPRVDPAAAAAVAAAAIRADEAAAAHQAAVAATAQRAAAPQPVAVPAGRSEPVPASGATSSSSWTRPAWGGAAAPAWDRPAPERYADDAPAEPGTDSHRRHRRPVRRRRGNRPRQAGAAADARRSGRRRPAAGPAAARAAAERVAVGRRAARDGAAASGAHPPARPARRGRGRRRRPARPGPGAPARRGRGRRRCGHDRRGSDHCGAERRHVDRRRGDHARRPDLHARTAGAGRHLRRPRLRRRGRASSTRPTARGWPGRCGPPRWTAAPSWCPSPPST